MHPKLIITLLVASLQLTGAEVAIHSASGQGGSLLQTEIQYSGQGAMLAGLQFDIQYDNTTLTLVGVPALAAIASEKTINSSDPAPNRKRFLIAGFNQTILSDGALLVLSMSINSAAFGPYELQLLNAVGVTPEGTEVALAVQQGTIQVEPSDALLPASSVMIGEGTPDPQGKTSIDITLTSTSKEPLSITALQFDIRSPGQELGFSVSSGSSADSAGKTIFTSDPQPGLKRVLIAALNQNPVGAGVIAMLSIEVKDGTPPGLYPLLIGNVAASDGDGSAAALLASAGGVIVPGDGGLAPLITVVANAASRTPGAVSPGEVVVIEGTWLSATASACPRIRPGGLIAISHAGPRILFDGVPGHILYATQNQLSAIVPYAVDGRALTSLQVESRGIRSGPYVLEVAKTSPGIFTLNESRSRQGAIVNEDGTTNGPANPARRGSVISIFATGEGQTVPRGVDGHINGTSDLRHSLEPVKVTIGGERAEVVYAGSAPGQVSGVFQVNVRVPIRVGHPNDSVPVAMMIGDVSAPGVTMAVR